MGVPKVLPLFSSGMQRGTEGKDENETDRPFSTVLRRLHISFLEYLTRRMKVWEVARHRHRPVGRVRLLHCSRRSWCDPRTRPGESPQILCWPESRTQDNSGRNLSVWMPFRYCGLHSWPQAEP